MPVIDQNFHFLCHSVQFSSYQVPTTWTSSLFLSVMLYLCQFFQIFLETLSLFKKQTFLQSHCPEKRARARVCASVCVCVGWVGVWGARVCVCCMHSIFVAKMCKPVRVRLSKYSYYYYLFTYFPTKWLRKCMTIQSLQ